MTNYNKKDISAEQLQYSMANKNFKLYHGDFASKFIIKKVRKYIKSPILDIGAGTGILIKELRKQNFIASGIDPVPKSKNVEKGDITKIEFSNNSFQTIFCSEVIEHLSDKQIDKGVTEIKRILIENGNLIVTVPFNENLKNNSVTCPKCEYNFHRMGHLQSFTKKRITKLMEDNGFTVIFLKIFPIGVITKLPLGWLFYPIFLKFNYECISKTIIIVAKKNN